MPRGDLLRNDPEKARELGHHGSAVRKARGRYKKIRSADYELGYTAGFKAGQRAKHGLLVTPLPTDGDCGD